MDMIKCLVWDLDETLWEGTLLEGDSPRLNPVVAEIVAELDRRGVLQSVASRNDFASAMGWLKSLEIDQFFLYPQIGHNAKVESIKRIARELNIGLAHLAFIDDNPFERYEVQQFLPMVEVFDPSTLAHLLAHPRFSPEVQTKEGRMRRSMMQARQERKRASEAFSGSREEFLKSCEMVLSVRLGQSGDLERAYELASRTNQLNNLLERPTRSLIQQYIDDTRRTLFVCELTDRFGDHGIVGVALITKQESIASIDLFCISCRVEGRGIGFGFLHELMAELESAKVNRIKCLYHKDKRNRPALLLLQMLGFKKVSDKGEQAEYMMTLPHNIPPVRWLNIRKVRDS